MLIPLHSRKYPGLYAEIDEEDYELVSKYRWHPHFTHGRFYAETAIYTGKKKKNLHMHRLICPLNDGRMVDHIDDNTLNNRRSNLRPSTNSQNQANAAGWSNNTSGCRGVTWNKNAQRWRSYMRVNKKQITIGWFCNYDDAVSAWRAAFSAQHGEYANTNGARAEPR